MKDFISINLGSKSVVIPKKINLNSIPLPTLEGTKDVIVQKAIDYVLAYDYSSVIGDPNLMTELGSGNCQAMSLTFQELMNKYNIDNELLGSGAHVYNQISLGDSTYIIDFANSILKEEVK